MKKIILITTSLLFISFNAQAVSCKVGKICGNSCIPTHQVCKITPPVKQKVVNKKAMTSTFIVVSKTLNVRALPRVDSKILGKLKRGNTVLSVTPASPVHGWKKIKFGNTHGWISTNYIKAL